MDVDGRIVGVEVVICVFAMVFFFLAHRGVVVLVQRFPRDGFRMYFVQTDTLHMGR